MPLRPLRTLLPVAAATALLLSLAGAASATATSPGPARSGLGATRAGEYVQPLTGEKLPAALTRVEGRYGRLGVVRVFQQQTPSWSSMAVYGDRPVAVSFRPAPAAVLTGSYDAAFRAFFAAAPTTRTTWWTYYHEADVSHDNGTLPDLPQYRAAFTRIAQIARSVGNPQLKTAVVLTGFTGDPRSHRAISDYWPGADLTDLVAWDIYNGWAISRGSYGDATAMLSVDRAASAAVGKPWAVTEFGSLMLKGDAGTGRAAWITTFTRWAAANGAQFVCYFDARDGDTGADYRLLDAPSAAALRAAVG